MVLLRAPTREDKCTLIRRISESGAPLDSDAVMKADDVAEKYHVRCSWVRLLKQRRRETGEVARVRSATAARLLAPHVHTLAALIQEQPDRTLAEIEDPLGTPASLGATGATCRRVT